MINPPNFYPANKLSQLKRKQLRRTPDRMVCANSQVITNAAMLLQQGLAPQAVPRVQSGEKSHNKSQ